jgi:hypothetical protein
MDTVLPTDASPNTGIVVIVPSEGHVSSLMRFDRVAITLVAGSSAVTELIISSQGGTIPSKASPAFDQGQSRFLLERESLEIADLQTAVENRDPRLFAQLASAMNWWNRPPDELIRAIDLALGMDMIPLARELTDQGKRRFSDEKRFQRLAAVLSPPVILGPRQSQPMDLAASQQWLTKHASEYRNQWVAVKGGNLLGTALTLKELHGKIGPEGKMPDTIIVKVLPDGAI